jgi:hypothetical protein
MQYKNKKNFSKSQVFENKKPDAGTSGKPKTNLESNMHYKDNKNSTQSQVQEDQELAFQNKSNDWKYFTIIPKLDP